MKNGRLLHIDDVERGLNCGCKCPACEHPLVAHKGPVKAAHFKHYQGSDCGKGVETALHHMAKGILENRQEIALPHPDPAEPTKLWPIEKVSLEKRLEDIIPDVIVYIEGQPILIEIVVTHGIDAEKMEKIKDLGISTLVINLSDEERTLSEDELASIVVEGTEKKRWVFNRVTERHRRVAERHRAKKLREWGNSERHPDWEPKLRFKITRRLESTLQVDGCPKPGALSYYPDTTYANVRLDCYECEFLVDANFPYNRRSGEDVSFFLDENPSAPDGYILCGWPEIAEHPNAIQS